MILPDISFIPENYEPILEEIEKLNVDNNSKELLRNIVREMKNYNGQIQTLEIRLSVAHYRFTDLKKDYKDLQDLRISVLNLRQILRIRALELESSCLKVVDRLNSSLDYKLDYLDSYEGSKRALLYTLEIEESRENRKYMRKLAFLAILVSAIFSYVTVWEKFAVSSLLPLELPHNLSPHMNWVITLLLLLPVFWGLIRGWNHLIDN